MSGSMHKEVPGALENVWKLTDVEISFVSACPQGANPGAKVMLKKENVLMVGKTPFGKEGSKDTPVNVNIDLETLSKSMSENLGKVMSDLLAKDKNLSAEAMTEAVVAVVTGDIAKMQKETNDELTKQLADFQKSIDAQIAKAREEASKGVNKDMGEETLELNGTTFKKSDVGEHAFHAIKASVLQQESLRKEIEHGKLVARVEKEYPNIAGKPEEKAALLGLIEKAEDAVKATGLAVLKALNEAGTEYTKEYGAAGGKGTHDTTIGKMDTDTDASLKLELLAKELADKENISVPQAYAKVLSTPEGEKLYNEHRGE